MASTSVLELILRLRKEGSTKGVESEIKDLKKANAELGAGAEKLNLGMLAVKGAVLSAGLAILASIPGLIQQGIEYNRAQTALTAYTGSAEAAAEATKAVQDAAGGAISKMDATANATRLFAMGLAQTTEEAAKLTDVAVTLGATMGKGPKQAFEEFTLMLANQSILRLDTFGISGAKVRARMEELASSVAGMTRETAFMTAVLEEADGKMAALDAAGFQASSSVERLKAMIEDAKLGIATWLADGIVPAVDATLELGDAVDDQREEILRSSKTFAEYQQRLRALGYTAIQAGKDSYTGWNPLLNVIGEVGGGVTALQFGFGNLNEEQFNAAKAAEETGDQIDEEALALETATRKAEAFNDAMAGAELSMDVVKSAIQGPFGSAYDRLVDLQADAAESAADYEERLGGLKKGTDDYAKVQDQANDSAEDWTEKLGDAEDALKKTTAQLIFQHAAIGLNAEDTLALANSLGLVDEKTFAVASATEHLRQIYDAADGQLDGNITNTQGYLQAIEDLNAEVAEMPPEQITKARVDATQAMRDAENYKNTLEEIPSIVHTVIENEIRYSQSFRYSTGHQHGAQFAVDGMPGPDRVPVSFMATKGETVTVTPPGMPAPPAASPIAAAAGMGGGYSFGDVYITNDMDLQMLANRLRQLQ